MFSDGTVKCIEDEIPFDVPDGWVWARLGNLSSTETNAFVDGPFGSNLKTEHYTQNKEVRIIQLNNIGEFKWKNDGVKHTTYEHSKTIERCITYIDLTITNLVIISTIFIPSLSSTESEIFSQI